MKSNISNFQSIHDSNSLLPKLNDLIPKPRTCLSQQESFRISDLSHLAIYQYNSQRFHLHCLASHNQFHIDKANHKNHKGTKHSWLDLWSKGRNVRKRSNSTLFLLWCTCYIIQKEFLNSGLPVYTRFKTLSLTCEHLFSHLYHWWKFQSPLPSRQLWDYSLRFEYGLSRDMLPLHLPILQQLRLILLLLCYTFPECILSELE